MLNVAQPAIQPNPIKLRQIIVPTEHGSWSFLLEPLIGGLIIAFSVGGLWIALMTIGAFLCRQPVKVLILDRRGLRNRQRAQWAFLFLVIFGSAFLIGLAGALVYAGSKPLLPFVAVLPLIALQIINDALRKSREFIAEISGATAISISSMAIAIAGGQSLAFAAALWTVFVGRFIPTVIYVRNRLLLEKGKRYLRTIPLIAHVTAALIVAWLIYLGLVPRLVFVVMALLLWRTINGLSPNRKKLKAMQIGVRELLLGIISLLLTVIGYLFYI